MSLPIYTHHIRRIHEDARHSFENHTDFGEIAFKDLVDWYLWRMGQGEEGDIPLGDYDVLSVESIFRDWAMKDL